MQPLSSHGDQTPIESIENSISVLVEATKGELLSRLRASDPTFSKKQSSNGFLPWATVGQSNVVDKFAVPVTAA